MHACHRCRCCTAEGCCGGGGGCCRYKIVDSTFTRLDSGVELTFEHPRGFTTDIGGYVLVCVPWLATNQWHAFSVYRSPISQNHSSVCMYKVRGDTPPPRSERQDRLVTSVVAPRASHHRCVTAVAVTAHRVGRAYPVCAYLLRA